MRETGGMMGRVRRELGRWKEGGRPAGAVARKVECSRGVGRGSWAGVDGGGGDMEDSPTSPSVALLQPQPARPRPGGPFPRAVPRLPFPRRRTREGGGRVAGRGKGAGAGGEERGAMISLARTRRAMLSYDSLRCPLPSPTRSLPPPPNPACPQSPPANARTRPGDREISALDREQIVAFLGCSPNQCRFGSSADTHL